MWDHLNSRRQEMASVILFPELTISGHVRPHHVCYGVNFLDVRLLTVLKLKHSEVGAYWSDERRHSVSETQVRKSD